MLKIINAMLTDRARTLLKILVERYIAEGEPVGSRTLSRHSGLDLSPASIRNIMSDLEEMGFVASPHTSAGRVPTPRGYRFFVDTLLTVRPLEQEALGQLEKQLTPDERKAIAGPAPTGAPIFYREERLVWGPTLLRRREVRRQRHARNDRKTQGSRQQRERMKNHAPNLPQNGASGTPQTESARS